MTDFPVQAVLPPTIIAHGPYSLGYPIVSAGITSAGPGTSTAWPVANKAIFVPFWLPTTFYLASMFVMNGTVVSGNIDLGVFSVDGEKIVSKGATAQAGTSTLQILTMTATLGPGMYYMAVSADNTTATVLAGGLGGNLYWAQQLGLLEAATQNPLATNPTFATLAAAIVPGIGIASITSY